MMMLIELIPKFHSSSQRGSIYLAKRSSANARGGVGALGWGVRVLDPHWGCKEGKGEVVQVGCKRGGEGWRSMRGTLTGWGVERWTVQGSNYGLDWSHQCLVQKCTDAMGSWSAMLIISFIKISGIARSNIRQTGFLIWVACRAFQKLKEYKYVQKCCFVMSSSLAEADLEIGGLTFLQIGGKFSSQLLLSLFHHMLHLVITKVDKVALSVVISAPSDFKLEIPATRLTHMWLSGKKSSSTRHK